MAWLKDCEQMGCASERTHLPSPAFEFVLEECGQQMVATPMGSCAVAGCVGSSPGPSRKRRVGALIASAIRYSGHAAGAGCLQHSRPLPEGDRSAGAFTGGAVGGECNLVALDAGNVLHDAFAVRSS